MGNCIDYQKAKQVSWLDLEEEEEWEYESVEYRKSKKAGANAGTGGDDEDLLRPLKEDFGTGAVGSSGATEIKIRISKKQLEKMLQQQATHGAGKGGSSLRLQQALAELMSSGVVVQAEQQHVGHWRPKLQSIAE